MFSLLIFLFTVAILVIVHEFGHYIVARACGVKVISFSVGFGPKIFSFNSKHNEWRLSAIPLGGYVRMLDEREAPVEPNLQHMAFNRKTPWQKILIAFAGPAFNILFALIAYFILALNGVESLRPVVASLNTELAQINHVTIPENSIITKINNQPVYSWENANKTFAKALIKSDEIKISYKNAISDKLSTQLSQQEQMISLQQLKYNFKGEKLSLENLGILPIKMLPQISYIEPSSPAIIGGLKIDDKIMQINQQRITTWEQVTQLIQANPNKPMIFIVNRNNQDHKITITPDRYNNNGQTVGKIGIMPTLDENLLKANTFIKSYNLYTAAEYAINSSYNIVRLNITSITAMISGKTSWHNIGGPVAIANAGTSAFKTSINRFVDFLALISLSLAFMNLLPIPVLDGGHIVIYLAEWITKKEINHKIQDIILKFGLVLILGLTFIALYNDALRLFSL